MNLPNQLTLLRIVLILPFLLVLYLDVPWAAYIALAIFILASLTDLLDGKIARKRNLITDFGKFADPLADKMLVTAAMLWFVENGQMPGWALLIVIVREFAVSGLRMVASDKGRQGEDRRHHGVHHPHVPAHPGGGEYPVRGGDRGNHHLLRGGVFHEEPGLPQRYVRQVPSFLEKKIEICRNPQLPAGQKYGRMVLIFRKRRI